MGFPKCHMIKSGNRIVELVIVPKKGEWQQMTRVLENTIIKTNSDFDEADNIYDTDQSAFGYMSPGSQSQNLTFESMEDVSEEDIKKFKDLIEKS
jgi:hypothetical protein